jgi:hypothetical protein
MGNYIFSRNKPDDVKQTETFEQIASRVYNTMDKERYMLEQNIKKYIKMVNDQRDIIQQREDEFECKFNINCKQFYYLEKEKLYNYQQINTSRAKELRIDPELLNEFYISAMGQRAVNRSTFTNLMDTRYKHLPYEDSKIKSFLANESMLLAKVGPR